MRNDAEDKRFRKLLNVTIEKYISGWRKSVTPDRQIEHLADITRFEVVDDEGTSYLANRPCKLTAWLQDDGRTLKIFVSERKP